MDRLALEGTLGQTIPIRHGITPGSGPSHLALFGYDPIAYQVGRGVLEAIGVGMEVRKGDVAARGNFCTVNAFGKITDRRAGRIPTDTAAPLVERIGRIRLTGVEMEVRPVKEYRFAVVMRGRGLEADIDDTDPQQVGVEPLPAKARAPAPSAPPTLMPGSPKPASRSPTSRGQFADAPGLLHGSACHPRDLSLRAACVAVYPMYGRSQLVGMDILGVEATNRKTSSAVAKSWTSTTSSSSTSRRPTAWARTAISRGRRP
jgi:2,3-bisphosphoglycerate-independent phosphoglycerate mutase